MSEDLSAALQDINGVGPATAEKILDILHDNVPIAMGEDWENDTISPEDFARVRELLEDAMDYHGAGEHSYAEKYARRALERLDG